MKVFSRVAYLFILLAVFSGGVRAACVSDEFAHAMESVMGAGARFFTSKRYEQVTSSLDGRIVLKYKDLDLGTPSNIANYDEIIKGNSVRAKIIKGGGTNRELMKNGFAPIGKDGHPVEIHHLYGEEPGPVAEVERLFHQKETAVLHSMIESSFRKNEEARKSWKDFRGQYWKRRYAELPAES